MFCWLDFVFGDEKMVEDLPLQHAQKTKIASAFLIWLASVVPIGVRAIVRKCVCH